MFTNMKESKGYPVRLHVTIRSDDGDDETGLNIPAHSLSFEKETVLPIPPFVGLEFCIWKGIPIESILVTEDSEVRCFLEGQLLPSYRFEKHMEKYQRYLDDGGWIEDKELRYWPDEDETKEPVNELC